jgi:predicted glycoside hydrolase/deacetylase ChbG (UPF0249 family)
MSYVNIIPTRAATGERHVIFNADDFGASAGVNRGIIECHQRGVLTSASLMVTGRALQEAVALSRDNPKLAIGLHFDVWGENEREFETRNIPATRAEFQRQLDEFLRVMGRPPTHVDSHRHVHREQHLFPHFREWVEPLGVPLRAAGQVRFIGGFYAQWEWMVTDLNYVSAPRLIEILEHETVPGYTEIACHPGYVSDDYQAVYLAEREAEVATLTDPRIRQAIDKMGLRLVSFADYLSVRPSRRQ